MRAEHWEALREGIVAALELGLLNGGASIDDYRDARGEKGSMQDEFLVHTREGEPVPALRRGDQADSRRRTVDLFLRGLSGAAAQTAAATPQSDDTVSEPFPLPDGFSVGHWTEPEALTGCTVLLPPPGSRGGVDVRGGGPGTRETDVLSPFSNAPEVTAVVLAGGSAYGLAAADGVARWCEEQGRGYVTPSGRVALVPAAVVYDLAAGDPAIRPGPEEGRAACQAAAGGVPERGPVGAGTGAAVGKILGRERASRAGSATRRRGCGEWTVSAIAVVNAVGDVIGSDGSVLAGVRLDDGSFGTQFQLLAELAGSWPESVTREATTLVCVCTDAPLSKLDCAKVARMASAGVARAIDPVFTPFDGDVVFCLASGGPAGDVGPGPIAACGSVAATMTAAAIRDAAVSGRG